MELVKVYTSSTARECRNFSEYNLKIGKSKSE